MSKHSKLIAPVLIAGAAIAFAACSESPTSTDASIYDDAAVTLDVASSAGDAAAVLVATMAGNDSTAGTTSSGGAETVGNVSVTRTRNCYDASNVVVANCLPFSSVRMIATSATASGSRSSTRATTGGGTTTWTGTAHRTSADTGRRIFTNGTETSRVHADLTISHDTTTFTDANFTRLVAENARDSVKNVTFALPRSSNPWPTSGSIVRVDSIHVAVSKLNASISKDIIRTVEVDFPADAQGNVTLKVNAKTCLLNLVTRAVTSCQ